MEIKGEEQWKLQFNGKQRAGQRYAQPNESFFSKTKKITKKKKRMK